MKIYEQKRPRMRAIQITEENRGELEALPGFQAVQEGHYTVESGVGKTIAHPGDWVCFRPGQGPFLMSDADFQSNYEEVQP
jgi:hypothetical protein